MSDSPYKVPLMDALHYGTVRDFAATASGMDRTIEQAESWLTSARETAAMIPESSIIRSSADDAVRRAAACIEGRRRRETKVEVAND